MFGTAFAIEEFQFYHSAIKNMLPLWSDADLYAFQFYHSAIKKLPSNSGLNKLNTFQFYHSAIKNRLFG